MSLVEEDNNLEQQQEWKRKLGRDKIERERAMQQGAKYTRAGARIGTGVSTIVGYKFKGSKSMPFIGAGAGTLAEGEGVGGAAKKVIKAIIRRELIKRAGLGEVALAINTIKQAKDLADVLNEEIKKGRSSGWIIAIILAAIKDSLDVIFWFLGWTFIDWPIDLFLWFTLVWFLRNKSATIFSFIIKRVGILPVIEVAPVGLDIMPVWTVTVLYAYYKSNQKIRELEEELKGVNKIIITR